MTRPSEIEPLSNRFFIHRVSSALVDPARKMGIHPNLVTLLGLLCGVLAAFSYARWADPRFAILGFLLMILWHIADGLDGALARATGQSSAIGRLLDGVADYSTFVLVYIALIVSQAPFLPMLALALTSGAAHILQSLFYEGVRETYIRRKNGRFAATQRTAAGGLVERLYNAGEAALGNHATALDRALAARDGAPRARLLRHWMALAAPRIRAATLLSANARTVAIFLACLAGVPWGYWLWEIVGLTIVAFLAARALRTAERKALAISEDRTGHP